MNTPLLNSKVTPSLTERTTPDLIYTPLPIFKRDLLATSISVFRFTLEKPVRTILLFGLSILLILKRI